jgi:hypothetical protein
MATEIQIAVAQPDTMRSLPPQLEKLSASLATVTWPFQPTRLHFPAGMGPLTTEERRQCETLKDTISKAISGENLTPQQCSRARLSLLTKMLLGFPVSGSTSVQAADARQSFYLEAIYDVAPWALNAAIKAWARGEAPSSVRQPNYAFAPSPADLRACCLAEIAPFKEQLVKLNQLLLAIPLERAMDPAPITPPAPAQLSFGDRIVPQLQRA